MKRLYVGLFLILGLMLAPIVRPSDGPLAPAGSFVRDVGNNGGGRGRAHSNRDDSSLVPTDPAHVLQAQDTLRVQVFGEEDINKQAETIVVSQDLAITLPLINVVNVRDKTIGETQELIRRLYDKDFLVNPQVNVLVLKYADRSINVIGSVTSQGHIQFPSEKDLSVVDAIALAGGQTRLADLKHVKLTRGNGDGNTEVRVIDVDAMMKSNSTESVLLKPGDTLFIPERSL